MGNSSSQSRFRPVGEEELPKVVEILERRLPKSSSAYNMVKMYPVLKPKATVYSLSSNAAAITNDSIILVNTYREETEQDIGISVPGDNFDKANLRDALIEIEKAGIDWNKSYTFNFLEEPVATIVFEVSTHNKGNLTHCNPCHAYVVDKTDEFVNENMNLNDGESLTLKNIDLNGGLEMIWKNWKFSTKTTEEYLQRILRVLPSTGLYLQERIVSGAVQNTNGVIGMLYTLPEERSKGYGVKVMRQLIREIRADGLAPCSVAEKSNFASKHFHEKVGMHKAHDVYYIWYTKKTEGKEK